MEFQLKCCFVIYVPSVTFICASFNVLCVFFQENVCCDTSNHLLLHFPDIIIPIILTVHLMSNCGLNNFYLTVFRILHYLLFGSKLTPATQISNGIMYINLNVLQKIFSSMFLLCSICTALVLYKLISFIHKYANNLFMKCLWNIMTFKYVIE